MNNRIPIEQVTDKPEPAQAVPDPIPGEETSPDIAGQTPPPGELTYFTDMRALSIQMGFEDSLFDGLGREADSVYNWAKKATGTNGGPETLMRIKHLVEDMGTNSVGKTLLRRIAHWTSLDSQTRDLNLRKQAI